MDYLNGFGLGTPLGIDLEGEGRPSVYASVKDSKWSANSLTQMSIGYEVAFTPIQILSFYNAVANQGNLVRPSFVQATRSKGGQVNVIEPTVLRKSICNEETLQQCRQMMEAVGKPGGTAFEAFKNSPYKVAGKTGTCWLWKNGSYQDNRYRASFVGYFPADKPKYSCIVVIEDPRGLYYASQVAAPVFRELADKIYSTSLDIHGNNLVKGDKRFAPQVKTGKSKNLHLLSDAFHLPISKRTTERIGLIPFWKVNKWCFPVCKFVKVLFPIASVWECAMPFRPCKMRDTNIVFKGREKL